MLLSKILEPALSPPPVRHGGEQGTFDEEDYEENPDELPNSRAIENG